MNDAEEVIAEQILDKVFYPSFDAQERTEDLKASQEFRSEVDELDEPPRGTKPTGLGLPC